MRGNGRGPEGRGPMTGRGLGNCLRSNDEDLLSRGPGRGFAGAAGRGSGRGPGRGPGRGMGRGNGFGRRGGSR